MTFEHYITQHSSSSAFCFRHHRFNDAHDLLTRDFHVGLEQPGTEFYIAITAGINDRHVFRMRLLTDRYLHHLKAEIPIATVM